MAQIDLKVKLDLPPGVELLGYERAGEGHGFEVKFPLGRLLPLRAVRSRRAVPLRVQEHGLSGPRPRPLGPAELAHIPPVLPSLLAVRTSPGGPRPGGSGKR